MSFGMPELLKPPYTVFKYFQKQKINLEKKIEQIIAYCTDFFLSFLLRDWLLSTLLPPLKY